MRFLNPITSAAGRPWAMLASLAGYAAQEDVTPSASGLIRADRPLGGLGVRLGVYRRELDRATVCEAIATCPGRPGAHSGLRSGDVLRAVSCKRTEEALLGYGNPAVAVCLVGPGSAGPEPERRCIASLEGLAGALAAPGAAACFARENPRFLPRRMAARLPGSSCRASIRGKSCGASSPRTACHGSTRLLR